MPAARRTLTPTSEPMATQRPRCVALGAAAADPVSSRRQREAGAACVGSGAGAAGWRLRLCGIGVGTAPGRGVSGASTRVSSDEYAASGWSFRGLERSDDGALPGTAVVRAGGSALTGMVFSAARRASADWRFFGIFGHAHHDDLVERGWEIAAQGDRRRGIGVELRGHQGVLRIGVEGELAGEHFVERGTEGINVGTGVGDFVMDLLGRHAERELSGAGGSERTVLVRTGDAEVHEFLRCRRA